MAGVIRRAKSGDDWTAAELAAYNIRVELQDTATFFGTPRLPDPVVSPDEVLQVVEASQATTVQGYVLLRTLGLAMATAPNEESAVVDFVAELLRACEYTNREKIARTRKNTSLVMCGENRRVKTDACLLDDQGEIRLLVQEDKCHFDDANPDPEPQLIAGAIAAFAANNLWRERTLGIQPLQSKVIPGITFRGTMPSFYKIPVTTDLVTAVQIGICPPEETVVYAHIPALPRPGRRWNEGMKPLDNRRIVLSCLEAFKQFIN